MILEVLWKVMLGTALFLFFILFITITGLGVEDAVTDTLFYTMVLTMAFGFASKLLSERK